MVSWIYTICHNKIKTIGRRVGDKKFIEIDSMIENSLVDPMIRIDEYIDIRDRIERIRRIAGGLLVSRKEILEYIDNWGENIGLPRTSGAKTRLHRGLKVIKQAAGGGRI